MMKGAFRSLPQNDFLPIPAVVVPPVLLLRSVSRWERKTVSQNEVVKNIECRRPGTPGKASEKTGGTYTHFLHKPPGGNGGSVVLSVAN